MKKSLLALAALAVVFGLGGCNYSEQKRQAGEYEQFLKQALGSVGPDAPQHAQASTASAADVD